MLSAKLFVGLNVELTSVIRQNWCQIKYHIWPVIVFLSGWAFVQYVAAAALHYMLLFYY